MMPAPAAASRANSEIPPAVPLPSPLCPTGRDLHSALQLTAAGSSSGERLFSWRRRGRRVAYDIAKALNYLHAKGVVHMDVVRALLCTLWSIMCDAAVHAVHAETYAMHAWLCCV